MLSEMFLNHPVNDTPPQMSMALQTVKTIEDDAADIYEEFLERAATAERICRNTGIQILGQYKLTDALPANLNPDEAVNTLLLIFQFYAKIKTASSHATFSAQEDDVNFMSFSKIEIFCRDFKVIPRLLTREELKMLWGDIARAHVLAGRGVFTVIDFDEFKDLIIRMSLWAYHKPGLKKLIITLEGFMPRNAEILQCFCHYLKLSDVRFINNFIRTKGRQTQGELNYRSKGETNLRTRMEVRADTDARKLSQVKSNTTGGANTSQATLSASAGRTPTKGKKMNIYGELEYEERHLRGANPNRVVRLQAISSPAAKVSMTTPEKPPKKASLLPPGLEEKLQPMDTTALLLLLRKGNNDDGDENFGLDSEASRTPRHSEVGSKSSQKRSIKQNSEKDDEESDDEVEEFRPKTASSFKRKKKSALQKPTYQFQVPDESDEDDDNVSVASSVISVFHDSSMEALRAAYDADYDPRLAKTELSRYCYVPPVANSTDFLPTRGPVVDLGLLQSGAKVTVQFRVSNGSGDDIFLDAIARDFHAEDTHISTYSKVLIPGFARYVSVTFTVPSHNCRVLGHVDVACISPRHASLTTSSFNHSTKRKTDLFKGIESGGGRCFISCPVFYRVDHLAHRDIFPVCMAGSLRPLLSRSSRRSPLRTEETDTGRLGTGFSNASRNTSNVIVNSRMGTGASVHRSDWDTNFSAQQRVMHSPLTTNIHGTVMNHGFSRPSTGGISASLSRSNSHRNVHTSNNNYNNTNNQDNTTSSTLPELSHWPSGRFTTLTSPLSRSNSHGHGLTGSSPFVQQILSLPRPSSPVPPSISGRTASGAGASFDFQKQLNE